jgi:hypothetical protein
MLTTLWITQRENAYVEIDKWHCNSKIGEPLLAALEAAASPLRFLFRATTGYDHVVIINCDMSGLNTCSIGNDHLNGAACIARLPPSGNNWMGMCCFPALFTLNNSQTSAGHGEDPIERSSTMARR